MTGIPLVDASMRELAATGYLSNRGRQNAASYLVHELGLDWRLGAAWFEHCLVDFDVASNWGERAWLLRCLLARVALSCTAMDGKCTDTSGFSPSKAAVPHIGNRFVVPPTSPPTWAPNSPSTLLPACPPTLAPTYALGMSLHPVMSVTGIAFKCLSGDAIEPWTSTLTRSELGVCGRAFRGQGEPLQRDEAGEGVRPGRGVL